MIGLGLYAILVMEKYGALYVVALGVLVVAAVCWGSMRKR
jgi:hypothetical protein